MCDSVLLSAACTVVLLTKQNDAKPISVTVE